MDRRPRLAAGWVGSIESLFLGIVVLLGSKAIPQGGPLSVIAGRGRSPRLRQLPHTGPVFETASAPKREGEVPWLSMQRSTCPRRRPQSVSLTSTERCGGKRR